MGEDCQRPALSARFTTTLKGGVSARQRTLPAIPGLRGYDAPAVHHAFALQDLSSRDDAEYVAHDMMETYEADHFRRVINVGERIG